MWIMRKFLNERKYRVESANCDPRGELGVHCFQVQVLLERRHDHWFLSFMVAFSRAWQRERLTTEILPFQTENAACLFYTQYSLTSK